MIDKEMIQDFIDEAEEHLNEMESSLLRIENEPGNEELLNDLFRAAHSIKGIAGLTGLDMINSVSHKMETLMDYLRQGKLEVSRLVVNTLFEGMDIINELVKVVAEKAEEQGEITGFLDKIDKILKGEPVETEASTVQEEAQEEEVEQAVEEPKDGMDELELFFREQAQIKSQNLLAVLDALALNAQDLEKLEEGVNECREFCNLAEASNLEAVTDPIQNMLDIFQQYIAASEPIDKDTVEALHSTLMSLMEYLGLEVVVSADEDAELAAMEEEAVMTEEELEQPAAASEEELEQSVAASEEELEQSVAASEEETAEAIIAKAAESEEEMSILAGEAPESIFTQDAEQEEEITSKTEEEQKEAVINLFGVLKTIKGLGRAKIQAIFDAGYTTVDELMDIHEKDLTQVKGITKPLAKKILEKVMALTSQKETIHKETIHEETASIESTADEPAYEETTPEEAIEEKMPAQEPDYEASSAKEEPDTQTLFLNDTVLYDEYDRELIEIFFTHINDSYSELSSAFSPETGKSDMEKVDISLEVINSLKKAANYMDFPTIVTFMTDVLNKLEKTKTAMQNNLHYDLEFMHDVLKNIEQLVKQIEEALYPKETVLLEEEPEASPLVEENEETLAEQEKVSVEETPAEEMAAIGEEEEVAGAQDAPAEQVSAVNGRYGDEEIENTEQEVEAAEEPEAYSRELEKPAEKEPEPQMLMDQFDETVFSEMEQEALSIEEPLMEPEVEEKSMVEEAKFEEAAATVKKEAEPKKDEEPMVMEGKAEGTRSEEKKEAEKAVFAKQKKEETAVPKETLSEIKQTLRVDTQKVDALMNQVGELVVNRALFSVVSEEFKANIKELLKVPGIDKKLLKEMLQLNFRLGEATQGLSRVANELQESVMKIRMLPISQLFNRYPRLVRELSLELSKKVTLKIRGENTELDKRVIEQMGDPLVHILRNSIDHGIETPKERVKKGKPPIGSLVLSSYYEGNHVVIRIEDDGRGIDAAELKQKAIDKGLIKPESAKLLTEEEALNLMFLPGISTASEITTTSGRGVGMDVVKKNVEKLNGLIEIVTQNDEGTAFIIKIPLTLAIIQVLVVDVLGIAYCIPLTSVVETVRIFHHEIRTIEGREVISLRDSTIPLIRLTHLFAKNGKRDVKDKTFVVIITTGSKEVGLVVDGLLGEQEVVIKPLGDYLYTHKEFSGATIMGDGSISLILEVSEIVNLAVEKMKNDNRSMEKQQGHAGAESERQLSLHRMR